MTKNERAEAPEGLNATPNAAPLPLGGGDFGAVAGGQKSMKLISANEGLSATPREGY